MNTKSRMIASCFALTMLAGTTLAQTAQPLDAYPLLGVVRDFAPQHADFANNPGTFALGSAGNVAMTISGSAPSYTGGGAAVDSPARDLSGRPIAPHLYSKGTTSGAAPVTDFQISGRSVKSDRPMAAKVTVIGAAISASGAYDLGVTMRVNVGSQTHTPFGSFDAAVSGNVNDNQNPRSFVLPGLIPADTKINIDGRSWWRNDPAIASTNDQDWSIAMEVNSDGGGHQVDALRDGDTPPDVGGFMGQASAKDMLAPYLDADGKIELLSNQVIYLFELGVTDKSSTAFDQQDLVVLVDLATDPSYFENPNTPGTPTTGCVRVNDSAARMGASSDGNVTSASTFATWFADVPGQSASMGHSIDMVRGADGVFEFTSSDFDPAYGQLYGAGSSSPNRGFTYAIDAACTYTQCGRQFIEVASDTEAWVYVNGKLVVDMSGSRQGSRQFVDLDRLDLTPDAPARVQIFYAQRSASFAGFSLRTNMVLRSNRAVAQPGVTGLYD
jgi:fibro-slime domain-containing protein